MTFSLQNILLITGTLTVMVVSAEGRFVVRLTPLSFLKLNPFTKYLMRNETDVDLACFFYSSSV